MNNRTVETEMSDAELDHLLAQASLVSLPPGAEERLLRKLPAVGLAPVAAAPRPDRRWVIKAALPLAASLLFGIYLGAGGYGDTYFSATTTSTAQEDDPLFTTGFEEAVTAAEESLT